ncbi:MAG TPA: heavy metal-associated domain-containing protein [Tepidisphaeraceae bacterium]|jgi:copper chaperone CopZ
MAVDKKDHQDQLAIIRIEGMHCHNCEKKIQQTLAALPGVREAEVDFPTGQASVLYSSRKTKPDQLIAAVRQAGYKVAGVANSSLTGSGPTN